MNNSPLSEARAEFFEFLRNYELQAVLESEAFEQHAKQVFKQYYSVLIWNTRIAIASPAAGATLWNDAKVYFAETTSDICQALFLSTQGLYKPSFLTLRSAVENYLKFVGLLQNANVLSLTSTFDLIQVVRSLPAINKDKFANQYFARLHQLYVSLCKHVHTADPAHMALTSVLGAYPKFDPALASQAFRDIGGACLSVGAMTSILMRAELHFIHHSHRDLVLEALPRRLKQHLAH